ncbi:MAG: hypothetical protein ACYDBB_24990 [Armatimonadota bacterium]
MPVASSTSWRQRKTLLTGRRSLLVGFLLCLIVLVGWSWCLRPQSCVFLTRAPAESCWRPEAWLRQSGFFYLARTDPFHRQSPQSLVFSDWNGRPCWRVILPEEKKQDRETRSPARDLAFSADGHVVAVTIAENGSWQVFTWRDGRALGQVTLYAAPRGKLPPRVRPAMIVLNTGRVLLWCRSQFAGPLYAIEGKEVVATGYFRSQLHSPEGMESVEIAPDGSALLACCTATSQMAPSSPTFEYASLKIARRQITITTRRLERLAEPLCQLFPGGAAVNMHGTVFTPQGKRQNQESWDWLINVSPYQDTAGGSWLLQTQGKDQRLFMPATGETWKLSMPGELLDAGFTQQGGHVLAYIRDVHHLHFDGEDDFRIKDAGQERLLAPARRCREFRVYERPGRLRAVLPLHAGVGEEAVLDLHGVRYQVDHGFLSPDGHRLILVGIAQNNINATYEFLVYGW